MARNDIVLASPQRHGVVRRHAVAAGVLTSIKAGEPVLKTLGAATVAIATTGMPTVATDFFVGIAASDSTDTVAAAGYVDVVEVDPRDVWSIQPAVAATWDTQTEYDALVGDRDLLAVDGSGNWTLTSGDGATYGCVIQPANILQFPGRVLFSFRAGVSYLV
jgi:hypothetical protein